jgi:hypothetical protein
MIHLATTLLMKSDCVWFLGERQECPSTCRATASRKRLKMGCPTSGGKEIARETGMPATKNRENLPVTVIVNARSNS